MFDKNSQIKRPLMRWHLAVRLVAGVQDEAASEAWQREMDRVRERSGRLLALVGLLLGTMLCLNTALVILPLTIGRAFCPIKICSYHTLLQSI